MNKNILFVIYAVDFIDNFGIAMLSAVAKKCGWHTFLEVFRKNTIDDAMARIQPNLVCYSVMSSDADIYAKINRHLKSRHDFVSIMGGPHPTFFPNFIHEDGVDFICRGEGEKAFATFLEKYERGENCEDVPNFATKQKANPVQNLINDLDSLPKPDRSLIFDKTELSWMPLKTFMTSRGCPFSCTYCYNNALKRMYRGKGRYARSHSVGRVIEEINAVRSRYPLRFIKFEDDLFAISKKWLETFSRVYKKEVGLPFNCLQRIDLCDKEQFKLLKEANCVSVSFSIDSANPRIREEILNRDMRCTDEEIVEKAMMAKAAGLNIMTTNIIGIPTSSMKDEIDGIELNIKCGAAYANGTILVPFPETDIWRYCKDNGLLNGDGSFRSIQSISALRGFTEKEKEVQWNLAAFLPAIVKFPLVRGPLLRLAQRSRPRAMYSWFFTLVKSYLLSRYVYAFRGCWFTKLRMLFKALSIETKRMLGRQEWSGL